MQQHRMMRAVRVAATSRAARTAPAATFSAARAAIAIAPAAAHRHCRSTLHTTTLSCTTIPTASAPASIYPAAPSSAPLRLAVLGAGVTGLTLAHQLQRQFREAGHSNVSIELFEPRTKVGGWVQSSHQKGFLMEHGPRSFAYRTDAASRTLTDLIAQLNLGPQIILADSSAAKRFVWNLDAPKQAQQLQSKDASASAALSGKLVALPTSLRSLWRFHLRSEILRAAWRERNVPPLPTDLPEEQSDQSVSQWIERRFGKTMAEELVDPLIAGIYAGDPKKLSLQSTLTRLAHFERRRGSVVRQLLWPFGSKTSESTRAVDELRERERKREFDRIRGGVQEPKWLEGIKTTKIYSLAGGVGSLTEALKTRLASDAHDPHAAMLARKQPGVSDAKVSIHTGAKVKAIAINESTNKPTLEIHMPQASARREFDHVFSTLPTNELHTLLAAPNTQLPLAPEHRASLLGAISPSATPFASVWVVHLIYSGELLQGDARGFGLLVPSRHAIPGLEILGVTFDSCVFPAQNSGSQPRGETRLTVMIGGDCHPWLVSELDEDSASIHAMRAVERMIGIDHRATPPLIVRAALNRDCIPQYYVGHAWRTNLMHEVLQHLAYTPSTYISPAAAPLPQFEVPRHQAAAQAPGAMKPLTLLGTNYGVSLNDCVYHATGVARDFVQRCMAATAPQPILRVPAINSMS